MIAIQTAVGEIGSKATTELAWKYDDMVSVGNLQYGANEDGIYQMNATEQDDGSDFIRTLTFATTDFDSKNPKRMRSLYFGIETDDDITVSVKTDDQSWRDYTLEHEKNGIQRVAVDIGMDGQGRYWTVKLSSTTPFRIDNIGSVFIIRPMGLKGY